MLSNRHPANRNDTISRQSAGASQAIPADFDWRDLAYPVTPNSGRAPIVLPSVLQPWDPARLATFRGFAREVIRERAILATVDPGNEGAAICPLSSVRARWILLTIAEQDAARARLAAVRPHRQHGGRESGRGLLDRLGADPSRTSGMLRCPAHEDRSPSLSWRLGADGRALLHCFSGCTFTEILAAVA